MTSPSRSATDAPCGAVKRIGLLYPGFSASDDYDVLAGPLASIGVEVQLAHTFVGVDAHEVQALLDLGSADRLADGVAELSGCDAVLWACTSGSFVFGWDGAYRQAEQVAATAGVPASSTSLAFVSACRALDVSSVSVAASYPADVAQEFVAFLGAAGIEVTAMGSHGIHTADEVGTLDREQVLAIVASAELAGAQALLVPDTAMHTLRWLEDLEAAAGVPVLTANQVTVSEGLRLLGIEAPVPGFGALMRKGVTA